jgi:hypothetical protein
MRIRGLSGITWNHRMYRVGVVNDSTAPIRGAQVLLEDCSAKESDEAVFPHHRMAIMDRRQDVAAIPPGAEPQVFIDVVEQKEPDGTSEPGAANFCYCEGGLRRPLKKLSMDFKLLVQGGGAEDRIHLQLFYGSDGRIHMTEIPSTA